MIVPKTLLTNSCLVVTKRLVRPHVTCWGKWDSGVWELTWLCNSPTTPPPLPTSETLVFDLYLPKNPSHHYHHQQKWFFFDKSNNNRHKRPPPGRQALFSCRLGGGRFGTVPPLSTVALFVCNCKKLSKNWLTRLKMFVSQSTIKLCN
jgi:hypothetical protein